MDQELALHVRREQSISDGWPRAPLLPGEEGLAPSQSASSSGFLSADRGDGGDAPSSSSLQSSTSLKERDYIGLAEVSSSAPPVDEAEDATGLKLQEPDLRLGLGLPNLDSSDRAAEAENRAASPRASLPAEAIRSNGIAPAPAPAPASAQLSLAKGGFKRLYAEAMADACREMAPPPCSNLNNTVALPFGAVDSRSCASSLLSKAQSQDAEMKSFLHAARRSAAPPANSWQYLNDPHAGLFQALPHLSSDLQYRSDGSNLQPLSSRDDSCNEAPPAKGQVVGWPPVRAYRRSANSACLKAAGEDSGSQPTMFVKVNMDGIPVGRKVDLGAYKTYDGLLSALEDMFRNSSNGYGSQFLKGADFVLTYEDKDGDWMLVGDVPWELFIGAVRRLRITRGSEMAGLGLRSST